MLLDTSAVIAIGEGRNERLIEIVRGSGSYSIASLFVTGELRHGLEMAGEVGRAALELRRATLELYQRITEMPAALDLADLATRYGAVSARATDAGLRIGQNDRWIIAEAAGHGVTLVTCDTAQASLMASYCSGEKPDHDPVVLVDQPA